MPNLPSNDEITRFDGICLLPSFYCLAQDSTTEILQPAGEEILQPAWRTKKSGIILPSNQVCMFAMTKIVPPAKAYFNALQWIAIAQGPKIYQKKAL